MITVTHAAMGEAVFGIAPGHAEVWATLRTRRDDLIASLCASAEALVTNIAEEKRLSAPHETFVASVNVTEAVEHLRLALDEEGVVHTEDDLPMRASEDSACSGTMPPQRCSS